MSRDRPTAADFHPEVLKLFGQYVHGGIDRRAFLDRSARYAAAGGTTAAGLIRHLLNQHFNERVTTLKRRG